MSDPKEETSTWTAESARRSTHLLAWTAAWVVSIAIATFGPKLVWDFATLPTVLAVIFSLAVGVGMILATKRHIQALDEMQERIFLDSAALTLGSGLVFGTAYEMLEDIRLITFEPEISHLVILMCLTFVAATVAGNRRYR